MDAWNNRKILCRVNDIGDSKETFSTRFNPRNLLQSKIILKYSINLEYDFLFDSFSYCRQPHIIKEDFGLKTVDGGFFVRSNNDADYYDRNNYMMLFRGS